jgi:hypothetical protein
VVTAALDGAAAGGDTCPWLMADGYGRWPISTPPCHQPLAISY